MKYTEEEIIGLIKTMTLDERRSLIGELYSLEIVSKDKFREMVGVDEENLEYERTCAAGDAVMDFCENVLGEYEITDKLRSLKHDRNYELADDCDIEDMEA